MHDTYEEESDEWGPSRSDQRREALAVFELALRLMEQVEARIHQLPLSDELRDLVLASKKITAQIARKRQAQYLAKQLRRADESMLQEVRAALDHDKSDRIREAQALHRVEHWRDRLVAEGDAALAELMAEHPLADRQHLRQLAKNAHRERLDNKPPHASRELFRELRELLSDTPQPED